MTVAIAELGHNNPPSEIMALRDRLKAEHAQIEQRADAHRMIPML